MNGSLGRTNRSGNLKQVDDSLDPRSAGYNVLETFEYAYEWIEKSSLQYNTKPDLHGGAMQGSVQMCGNNPIQTTLSAEVIK
jgi:hypothetical protein